MDTFDAYVILGIPRNSTYKEVRGRYLQLAKQNHPDKHQGSKESIKKFQDIECAYRLIVDPASFKQQTPKPSNQSQKKQPPPPPPSEPSKGSKFKKGQNLDDFLNELYNEGCKKTGKKRDKWS